MNSKIKSLIIEDNKEASDYLTSLLKKNLNYIEIIGHSDSVKESIKKIDLLKPEIIFMDIVLKGGNAFEILDAINHSNFEVIFITGYNKYLEKAMNHYAFYYILKPFDLLKLEKVIKRYLSLKKRMFSLARYKMLMEFVNDQSSKLMIHVYNEYLMIDLKEVIKCEAEGNYTFFYFLQNKKLLTSKPLKYYDDLLSFKGFFRAHRSILINIGHIKSIYKKEAIILKNNEKIIVSQRKKADLSNLIKLFS